MHNFYSCFIELAKQPVHTSVAFAVIYITMTADKTEKEQILNAFLETIKAPNSMLVTGILFILLIISIIINVKIYFKYSLLKIEKEI